MFKYCLNKATEAKVIEYEQRAEIFKGELFFFNSLEMFETLAALWDCRSLSLRTAQMETQAFLIRVSHQSDWYIHGIPETLSVL